MNKMKILSKLIIIFLFFQNFSLAETSQQVDKISKNLRCLICQGQTIHESNSNFAESMKKYIKGELDDGKTKEEIFASLVEKYGQWIIYDPGISKNTLLLWALPLLLFFIGGAIIVKKIFEKYE